MAKYNTVTEINAAIQVAKSGIWNRAKATANPKGYILNQKYMADAQPGTDAYCYNLALTAAKKWAKAPAKAEVKVYSIDMAGVDYLPA